MGNIPVHGGDSETYIRWADGQKQVYTDGGSRVDIYEGGQGRPDGPGHDHYWATFDQNGNMTTSGGRA
jgi:hypothetical protein